MLQPDVLCLLVCVFCGCDIIYPEASQHRNRMTDIPRIPHTGFHCLFSMQPSVSGKIQALFRLSGASEAPGGGLMGVLRLNVLKYLIIFYD